MEENRRLRDTVPIYLSAKQSCHHPETLALALAPSVCLSLSLFLVVPLLDNKLYSTSTGTVLRTTGSPSLRRTGVVHIGNAHETKLANVRRERRSLSLSLSVSLCLSLSLSLSRARASSTFPAICARDLDHDRVNFYPLHLSPKD